MKGGTIVNYHRPHEDIVYSTKDVEIVETTTAQAAFSGKANLGTSGRNQDLMNSGAYPT